jgi:hypothetical protein
MLVWWRCSQLCLRRRYKSEIPKVRFLAIPSSPSRRVVASVVVVDEGSHFSMSEYYILKCLYIFFLTTYPSPRRQDGREREREREREKERATDDILPIGESQENKFHLPPATIFE